ncbi:hypothetical protein F0U44_02825 [Nocardioides humilatus]|uniref:Uncharacterized protein n=1 Tax=Nocardioides humilatus TaxID=2607660 RepID=A0A5B1LL14_9ACTN|nr:hypothetical protein [Nocardioides humilatus]KAA1421263.1 hypothetical protein F0U44_02825 [Nocardioides humilatus]
MGCLAILLAVAALVATYGTGLFVFAIVTAVVTVWTVGIFSNYRDDPEGAPNYVAIVSMGSFGAAIVLLIAGVVVRSSGGVEKIDWDEAKDHVGDTKMVCGPVVSVREDGGDTFINIGLDYPDPGRFTIVVWNQTGLMSQGSGTACIEGEIKTYRGSSQITTTDWEDVKTQSD